MTIGKFQKASQANIAAAVAAAEKAFAEWSALDYTSRVSIFRKAADLLSQRKFEMAAILSYENGKTRYESMGEVDEGIDFMRYYAAEMESNRGFIRKRSLKGASDPRGRLPGGAVEREGQGLAQALRRLRRHSAIQLPGFDIDRDEHGCADNRQHGGVQALMHRQRHHAHRPQDIPALQGCRGAGGRHSTI